MPIARLVAPTARVPMQTAGRPVSCAWASAMNAAAPSWRVATMLIPTASRPSSRPRKLSPGTVKAQRTPARRIASANIRPTDIGCGGAAGSGSDGSSTSCSVVASTSASAAGSGASTSASGLGRVDFGLGDPASERGSGAATASASGGTSTASAAAGASTAGSTAVSSRILGGVGDLVRHGTTGPGIEVMTRLRISITTTIATSTRASTCDPTART